jgi:UDP-N-acetylmuramyl pentapeptide phosphotransferase/UDP-N-acetylglucosamine-1-phosphate transferase
VKNINIDPQDLKPIETDGINLLYVGTVLFALATLVLIYQPDFIDNQTQIIWLRITVMGTILGLIGLRIIKRRRKRLGL